MQSRRRLGKGRDPNGCAATLANPGQVWVKQEFRVQHEVNVQLVTGGLILGLYSRCWVRLDFSSETRKSQCWDFFSPFLNFDVRKQLININFQGVISSPFPIFLALLWCSAVTKEEGRDCCWCLVTDKVCPGIQHLLPGLENLRKGVHLDKVWH